MKKLLSILTSVGLTSSAFSVTLSSTKNVIHNNAKSDENNFNSVEWAEVKKMTFDIFNEDIPLQFVNDVSNNKNIVNRQLNQNSIKDISLQKAKEESEKLINEFIKQDISLDKALDFIKDKYPQFKEEYNKQISTYKEKNYSELTNLYLEETQLKNSYKEAFNYLNNSENVEKYNTLFSSAYQKNRELVSRLKTAKISFVILIASAAVASAAVASAAVASAGFYAAAHWTFGATIPWAVGCTAISIASGVVSVELSKNLLIFDKEAKDWQKIMNIVTIGSFLAKRAKEILVVFNTAMASFSWAMPALITVLAIGIAMYNWINSNYE